MPFAPQIPSRSSNSAAILRDTVPGQGGDGRTVGERLGQAQGTEPSVAQEVAEGVGHGGAAPVRMKGPRAYHQAHVRTLMGTGGHEVERKPRIG